MLDLIIGVLKIAEVVVDATASIFGWFRGSDQDTDDAECGVESDRDE
ncbi:hypothetical protein [Natronorubrum halophilum]|nr:hypothetical protein [Natronorubrum halophilum]